MSATDGMTTPAPEAVQTGSIFFLMLGPLGLLATLYLLVRGWMIKSANSHKPESDEYKQGQLMMLSAGPAFIISMAIIMMMG